jgi:hypothetical protein
MRLAARCTAALLVAVNIGVAAYALTRRQGYAELLMIYWAETVVLGILNIPKLIVAAIFRERIDGVDELRSAAHRVAVVLLVLLFYVTAFSLAWMLLFVAISALPMLLEHADRAAGMARPRVKEAAFQFEWVVASLAMVHVFSFFANFLAGREFRGASLLRIAVQPFLRTLFIIVVMAVAAVVAFIQPGLARTTAFALVVVLAKLAADLFSHLDERRRFAVPAL